jgi:CheY-like chemotaxis protein
VDLTGKILFADDDPLMLRLYQHHLARAGFSVVGASTGREAVETADCQKPQLAILDYLMPEMDGLFALLELKKAESTKAIPVIVISADPDGYRYQRQFTDAGAAAFLTKPFSPAQLLEVVHRLLLVA